MLHCIINRRIILFALATTLILFVSCQKSIITGMEKDDGFRLTTTSEATETLSMDDVAGSHNPQMIGIYGGLKTQETWWLRQQRSGKRVELINQALFYYYAFHNQFPENFSRLDESGLYPIRPLYPISGEPVIFVTEEEPLTEFRILRVIPSIDGWKLVGLHPESPDGNMEEYTWDYTEKPPVKLDAFEQKVIKYPNLSALRGAMLAFSLNMLVIDYRSRRNMMPETKDELLDGLWTAAHFSDDELHNIDTAQPGSFIFGYDKDKSVIAAVWHDDSGVEYRVGYYYNPWPEEGWQEPPTVETLRARSESAVIGVPAELASNYTPPNVLWKCSLLMKE